MIKNFKDKETKKVFNRQRSLKLPPDIHRIALRKLYMLDAAIELNDLKVPPGNKLEKLKKERKGQHAIRINNQWRVCFVWKDGDTYNVEIVDYH